MNRFESETYTATDRDHDEYVAQSLRCDNCKIVFASDETEYVDDVVLCLTCALDRKEEQEEESCQCVCSGDQADATYCDPHNPPVRKGPRRVTQTSCALNLCHAGAHLWVSVKSLPQPGECPAKPPTSAELYIDATQGPGDYCKEVA